MHFEGEFRVPGTPDEVIHRFSDVPRMARCMPGAVLEQQAEDGSWPGAMVVSFGPKKINFKGRATCNFDFAAHTGEVHGRGTANMRAARIGVKVGFTLHPDPDAATPTTVVKVVSDADLGGVLADFARTGGIPVANAIMADFARRASEEFARDAGPAQPAEAEAAAPESPAPEAEPETQPQGQAHPPPQPQSHPPSPQPGPQPQPRSHQQPQPEPQQRSQPQPPSPPRPQSRPQPQAQPAVPLAAHSLLWVVVKAQFLRLARWLGLHRTNP